MVITLENAQQTLFKLSPERARAALEFIAYLYEQDQQKTARRQLVTEIAEARQDYQAGEVTRGTVDNLMAELER
ncbi:MAG TPA: hypothetical protein G4N96_03030 [Chloroflexi bacterium]|nr:hypothetical protein [Chloroflexota bacterium]